MLNTISKNAKWFFLVFLSLSGVGLAIIVTWKYGAGLAGDSVIYISVADNLIKGNGFLDFAGKPLVYFPPLLPILIAGLAWIFQKDVFVVGGVFNIILWSVNIFLSGVCLLKVFQTRLLYFYISIWIVFISTSSLAMHASILSDPLFLTFTLLFFWAGGSYGSKPSGKSYLAMFAIAVLAPLLRFSGFAHIVAGCLVIFFVHIRKFFKGITLSAVFGFFTLLPTALWIYLHNYLPYRTWWGTTNANGANPVENIIQSIRKVLYWFIPARFIPSNYYYGFFLVLVALLILLFAINKKQDWVRWAKESFNPYLAVMLVFTVVYYSSSILNIQTADHKALFSDRYYVIIIVPILILIFISYDQLVLPHLKLDSKISKVGLIFLFLLWSVYPLSKNYDYLRSSLFDGELIYYNQYNVRSFHESNLLSSVKVLLENQPGVRLYSNIPPAVWFFTRHTILLPPAQDTPRTKDQIKKDLAGWPHKKPGYYVWFEPDPFELFMPLDDLYLVADMEIVEKVSDGMLVRVWSREKK